MHCELISSDRAGVAAVAQHGICAIGRRRSKCRVDERLFRSVHWLASSSNRCHLRSAEKLQFLHFFNQIRVSVMQNKRDGSPVDANVYLSAGELHT